MASLEANKAVVRRYIEEAMNGRDIALAEEIWAVKTAEGKMVVPYGLDPPFLRHPFETTIVDLIAENDKVVVRARHRPSDPQAAGAQAVGATAGHLGEVQAIYVLRIANAQIVEMWAALDPGTLSPIIEGFQQILGKRSPQGQRPGFLVPPGGSKDSS
jgi:hypothetical protein